MLCDLFYLPSICSWLTVFLEFDDKSEIPFYEADGIVPQSDGIHILSPTFSSG